MLAGPAENDVKFQKTMPAKRFVIHGRVQGVGFRAYTLGIAERLGIQGQVWNRGDGNVEAVASHPEAAMLDEFEYLLDRGPGLVKRISWEPANFSGEGFSIEGTR